MTADNTQHLEALQDIRNMMKKNTRFLSLSGLSGVFAGIFALMGAGVAYIYLEMYTLFYSKAEMALFYRGDIKTDFYIFFFLVAGSVLVLSILTAYYFSNRRAKKEGHSLFDPSARRALINLAIPLIIGGILCLAMLYHNFIFCIAPAMLIFYGLALINASKYTYEDIRYLGLCEAALGLIAAFDLFHGLLYWSLGFGGLHIVYGMVMWFKYERKKD